MSQSNEPHTDPLVAEGPAGDTRLHVGRSHAWLVLAALLAAAFVLVIGPGADLSALG